MGHIAMRFAAFGAVISQKVCLLLHLFVLRQLTFRQFLNLALFTPSVMSHGQFIVAYETVPLGFLISIPKALRILLVHKIREPRFQLLLFNWAFALLALLGAGICGFGFMPMFLAVGVFLFFWCFSSARETSCWISPWKMSGSSSWRSDATL